MTHPVLSLGSRDGVLLRREAVANGVDDDALRRLVRAGVLVRLRQGAYADKQRWELADAAGRHAMLTSAVVRLYGQSVVLSNVSAALAFGAPTWGLDLRSVHITHQHGSSRRMASVVHHQGRLDVGDRVRRGDVWVTAPARTILDVACTSDTEASLVVACDLLHRGLVTIAELRERRGVMDLWPGSLNHHIILGLADPRYESAGETRAAYLFWREGLPAAVPQYEVLGRDGTLLGRVDFAWPELGVIVEFDGRSKYEQFRRPGESVADVVLREKAREDRIREATGWIVIRLVWADLSTPRRTAERIRSRFVTNRSAS